MEKQNTGVRKFRITLWITENEQRMIEETTKRLGVNRSDFFRYRLFSPDMMDLNHSRLLTELASLGQSMNEINLSIESAYAARREAENEAAGITKIYQIYIDQRDELEKLLGKLIYRIRKRR